MTALQALAAALACGCGFSTGGTALRGGAGNRAWAIVACALGLAAAGWPASAPAQEAAGSGATQPAAAAEQPDAEPFYEVGEADVLSVEVRGEPLLSGTYPVRPDGRIALPLAGEVRAVGRTPGAIADRLEQALARYLSDPRVTVTVVQAAGSFASRIRVIGSGVEPASLPYRTGMTALDLVAALGGLPDRAAGERAYILRRTDAGTERIALRLGADAAGRAADAAAVRLRPGDTVVIPEGFLAGDWTFRSFAVANQTYTDNVNLEPDGRKRDALITEVGPGFNLTADMARVQGTLEGQLLYQRQSLHGTGGEIRPTLSGTGTVEWLDNLLLTDADASVSQETLDSSRGSSANRSNDSTQRTVQSYRVSPYVVRRLGRLARAELRYAGALTLISQDDDPVDELRLRTGDDASNSFQHEAALTLASGPRFDRYGWELNAVASELTLDDSASRADFGGIDPGSSDQSRREVVLRNRYAVTRSFDLIADLGYQKLDSRDPADSFEAPLWAAGFQWSPSPDTSVEATAGVRNDDESFQLDAHHALSARTEVRLSYREEVATGQQRLANQLAAPPEDGSDPRDPTARFSVLDDTTRSETLQGTLTTTLERTDVRLSAAYRTEQQDVVDGEDNEERISLDLNLSRPLSRDTSLSTRLGYAHATFTGLPGVAGTDVVDNLFDANLRLTYTGLRRVDLSASYSFSKRLSTRAGDDYQENAITLGARINF